MRIIEKPITKAPSWIKSDFPTIRRTLITTAILNLIGAFYVVFTMYQNQKLIIYRLDKLEAGQKEINQDIKNLYYEQKILSK